MQNKEVYQSEEYKGYTIQILPDTDPQNCRTEWDNMGTMVCWHKRYDLGDEYNGRPISKDYSEPDYLFAEIAGIDRDSDYCTAIYDKQGHEALSEYLYQAASKHAFILPLYLYDHSGLSISTGSFGDKWDSGQVGYIYATFETVRKEYSCKRITAKVKAKALALLQSEVADYDDYLTGSVYGFNVVDPEGEDQDSCWGFYGDEGIKQAIEDAKSGIDYALKYQLKTHLTKLKEWIKNKVPFQYRKPLQLSIA